MNKEDVTTIILTKNEEANIAEAIRSAQTVSARVVVVDSGSTDGTVGLAKSLGAEVFFHEWPGYAAQINWALSNCSITTPWTLRLDADERIGEDLTREICSLTPDGATDAYEMRWYVHFMGRRLRHGGTHGPFFLRLFRSGKGRADNVPMDERIVVPGRVERLSGSLEHHDYKGLDAWLEKHIRYSELEAEMYESAYATEAQGGRRSARRSLYYRLPPFLRARLYFWYRYFFQLGFLDGVEGKTFLWLQSYWYRMVVDAKLYERGKTVRA